jgi:hypothetical protein
MIFFFLNSFDAQFIFSNPFIHMLLISRITVNSTSVGGAVIFHRQDKISSHFESSNLLNSFSSLFLGSVNISPAASNSAKKWDSRLAGAAKNKTCWSTISPSLSLSALYSTAAFCWLKPSFVFYTGYMATACEYMYLVQLRCSNPTFSSHAATNLSTTSF